MQMKKPTAKAAETVPSPPTLTPIASPYLFTDAYHSLNPGEKTKKTKKTKILILELEMS